MLACILRLDGQRWPGLLASSTFLGILREIRTSQTMIIGSI